jgi:hypothetical protein
MNIIVRDYFAFTVNHNFKVSPSGKCVSAAAAAGICKDFDLFDKDYILLTYILWHCT